MKKPLKIKLLALLAEIAALDIIGDERLTRIKASAAAVNEELAREGRTTTDAEPSERGMRFAEWCAGTLINLRTTSESLRKWALCYDALVTRDGHTPERIAAVWTFARSHDFYRKVVITPLKLRQLDSAGVRWFDRLALAMENKPAPRQGTVQITKAGVTQ